MGQGTLTGDFQDESSEVIDERAACPGGSQSSASETASSNYFNVYEEMNHAEAARALVVRKPRYRGVFLRARKLNLGSSRLRAVRREVRVARCFA